MSQPIPDSHSPEVKYRVAEEDLKEFATLFKTCANLLRRYDEESLALECEQTVEFIEGYYLPYPEKVVNGTVNS